VIAAAIEFGEPGAFDVGLTSAPSKILLATLRARRINSARSRFARTFKTLKKSWSVEETPYPKKRFHLPVILSQEEVARLIESLYQKRSGERDPCVSPKLIAPEHFRYSTKTSGQCRATGHFPESPSTVHNAVLDWRLEPAPALPLALAWMRNRAPE
jgi:hypothetical protein